MKPRDNIAGMLVVGVILAGATAGSGTALFVGFVFVFALIGAVMAQRRNP